jgi:hypothetical protein
MREVALNLRVYRNELWAYFSKISHENSNSPDSLITKATRVYWFGKDKGKKDANEKGH